MQVKKLNRRYITLIEMMIVMFLIAMITGVIAYNYTGTLEKGKIFKTEMAIEKIKTALALEAANGRSEDIRQGHWKEVLQDSPLIKNPKEFFKDAWGDDYNFGTRENENGEIEYEVTSRKLGAYKNKNQVKS